MKNGNPEEFSKISKYELDQFNIINRMNPEISNYLKSLPWVAFSKTGLVFTHAGPYMHRPGASTVIWGRPNCIEDKIRIKEGAELHDNIYSYSKEDVDKFLNESKKDILISGHTPIQKGFASSPDTIFKNGSIIYGNQIIFATSFGALNEERSSGYKKYLEIDLEKKYDSAEDLVSRCTRNLYDSN